MACRGHKYICYELLSALDFPSRDLGWDMILGVWSCACKRHSVFCYEDSCQALSSSRAEGLDKTKAEREREREREREKRMTVSAFRTPKRTRASHLRLTVAFS